MRFLVVGLGSMGKRRVRNLHALGRTELAGYDPRQDRRSEAAAKYGLRVYDSFDSALAEFEPTALVISTGPRHHMDYALPGSARGLHCFIEASIGDRARIQELQRRASTSSRLVMAPSCTMRYFPGPRAIKELIRAGRIGKPLNINYQTGQYLPDWHPWESIRDFYVSQRETGGCREIVPFELTWINDIFGDPQPLACVKTKLTDMDANIDDVYHCILKYPDGLLANITVEVISRPKATREMRILGSEGAIVFSGEENTVRHNRVAEAAWTTISLACGTAETGYINPEEPYVAEMADFVRAVERGDSSLFPNTLADDIRVLTLVDELEALAEEPT